MAIISTISIALILRREISKRRKHGEENTGAPLFVSKWLSAYSLIALITALINRICGILLTFKFSCLIMEPLIAITLSLFTICFNYYNLARLYYCFSKSKTYTDNGYSNLLFICLYIAGLLLWANMCATVWVHAEHDSSRECIISYGQNYYYNMNGLILIFVWTGIILFLFYYKIRKFTKKNKQTPDSPDNNESIRERIGFILSKIFCLTVLVDVCQAASAGAGLIGTLVEWTVWIRILYNIASNICMVASAVMMYIMLEHNIRDYLLVLRIIDGKVGLLCCCPKVAKIMRPHIMGLDQKTLSEEVERSMHETTTIGNESKVKPIQMTEMSEQTQTHQIITNSQNL